MLATTLLGLGAFIAAVLLYAAARPKTFLLQRSVMISAPPDRIFALINDLQCFNRWNPFAREDPEQKLQYEAITQGNGAAYTWSGPKSGAGRMQVTESVPPQRVAMDLHFTKPMEANNKVVFSLKPEGAVTQVTWEMSGGMPYAHRLMTMFFSMEKMVGSQFEQGLASLKALSEAP